MQPREFDVIRNTSNINKKTCSWAYDGRRITYFHVDHNSGNSLTGKYREVPVVYDIMAVEGANREFTSVKLIKPEDAAEYIKKIFSMWEKEDA